MITHFRTLVLALACFVSMQIAAQPAFTPQNTTIFFDLHDVVLKRDKTERFKLGFKNMRSSLKLALTKVSRKGCANGEEYALKLRKHGYIKEAELVRKWSAAYKINEDVVEIIKELQARGYTVSMASNIGTQHLDDLMNPSNYRSGKKARTRAEVREVIDLFDDLIFVNYEGYDIVAKPSPEYFKMVQDSCKQGGHAIFIDDSSKNVDAAKRCGVHGLRFTSAKQLKKDLQTLNIL